MDYLQRWSEDLLTKQSTPLARSIQVQGLRDVHLGPRSDFAKVEILVEPADAFDVAIKISSPTVTLEQRRFLEYAVFGFLDVVMTAEPYPIKNVRLSIISAEFHPINSSVMAFRLAGRDAGRKLLGQLRPSATKVE